MRLTESHTIATFDICISISIYISIALLFDSPMS